MSAEWLCLILFDSLLCVAQNLQYTKLKTFLVEKSSFYILKASGELYFDIDFEILLENKFCKKCSMNNFC